MLLSGKLRFGVKDAAPEHRGQLKWIKDNQLNDALESVTLTHIVTLTH